MIPTTDDAEVETLVANAIETAHDYKKHGWDDRAKREEHVRAGARKLIEEGPVREVILDAKHPYTRGLLSALPRLDDLNAPLTPVPGDIPSPLERPSGCVFNTRCGEAFGDVCTATVPLEQWVDPAHRVSCHIYDRQHKGGGAS